MKSCNNIYFYTSSVSYYEFLSQKPCQLSAIRILKEADILALLVIFNIFCSYADFVNGSVIVTNIIVQHQNECTHFLIAILFCRICDMANLNPTLTL